MLYEIAPETVHVYPWVLESGEWMEDTFRHNVQNFVVAQVVTEDGSFLRLVHENAFPNDEEAAERLARRVAERGVINSNHWCHHGFISMSLEESLAEEAVAEDYARRGYAHEYNGPCR